MRVGRASVLTLTACLLSVFLSSRDLSAQDRNRRRGFMGDWRIKMKFGERTFESILAFSRDAEGNPTGQWISFFGVNDLKDVKFEDGKLSFTQSRRGRDGQTFTSKFTGSITDGKLAGTLSSDRGDTSVEGTREPRRRSRAIGIWETKFSVGDREITNTLLVTPGKEAGTLAVAWKSDRVQHKISDVQYERGTLTFKSDSKLDDREWTSNFEGTFERDAYSGVLKSERGEIPVKGTRVGAPVIGTWNLTISSDNGDRNQRLVVYPDMTGLYGSTPVEKVELKDGQVSFKISLEFGDNSFDINFKGKLSDSGLTGELTTSRGTQKVTGKKVERRRGRRGGGGGRTRV